MRRPVDMGDRIEIMKLAAEFAAPNQMKPLQFYHQMLAAVSTEPEKEIRIDEQAKQREF